MAEAARWPVVREAGDSALLLELGDRIEPAVNARAVVVAESLRARALAGVRDVVATIRSVAAFFDPLQTDVEVLTAALRAAAAAPAAPARRETLAVPVVYGGDAGPDLGAVAEWAGLPVEEVIARHAAPVYRVYMMGFLPGFAYLGTVDPGVAVPRRPRPRLRVPAGSVGIAGQQTGVYPSTSPGGWQLVGRSQLRMFDPGRDPVSLLAPGDLVRFVSVGGRFEVEAAAEGGTAVRPPVARQVTVVRPGMFTTVQDLGRWGYQDHGVPVAGAMDADACRRSNLAVGNEPGAAVLEATLVGPELRLEVEARVAVSGANLAAAIDGDALPRDRAVRARAGSVLRFGDRHAGARAYLAFEGGVDVPLVLESRSTHARSGLGGLGGRPLRAGDQVPLGRPAGGHAVAVRPRPLPAGGARLRLIPGPQLEAFAGDALGILARTRFEVSSQSDRMGYRLAGPPLPGTPPDGAMISEATFPGAVQVPPSGEPILLLADRPTTGGYPQIGVVASVDLSTAAQLAPGDWIEFVPCSRREAVAALAAGQWGGDG